jgi:tRNA threonylcarbamoyladenosine biosynthesis protein TsaE
MPILDSGTLEFFSRSTEQTRRVGMRLGMLLGKGDLICLSGDLGSGKTVLVQGMAQGWGSLDHVTSPTFVLVNEYSRPGACKLFHMDAYRIDTPREAEDLDLTLMLEQGALVIEWAERIKSVLPPSCLWINMRWVDDEQRGLVFLPKGRRYELMLKAFRQKAFGG